MVTAEVTPLLSSAITCLRNVTAGGRRSWEAGFEINGDQSEVVGVMPPDFELDMGAGVVPLGALLAAVLILLIVCINVAGLLTARAASRSGEVTIRSAGGRAWLGSC